MSLDFLEARCFEPGEIFGKTTGGLIRPLSGIVDSTSTTISSYSVDWCLELGTVAATLIESSSSFPLVYLFILSPGSHSLLLPRLSVRSEALRGGVRFVESGCGVAGVDCASLGLP